MSANPHDPSGSDYVFRLPRHALRILGIAAGAGFLLFLLAWWLGRDDDFYTVEPEAKTSAQVEALPAPLPADVEGASGLDEPVARTEPAEPPPAAVAEIESAPLPAVIEEAPASPEYVDPSTAPPAAQPATPASEATAVPSPIPGQSPSPAYPASALRSNETGTVLLRALVGADGVPIEVNVVGHSGSRDLDRAAANAVRQWRFNPAQRNGQPVEASVDVPITFSLER